MALVWFKRLVEEIEHYPKRYEWYEKVKSLVNNATIWECLKKYVGKNGEIIEKKSSNQY